MWGCEELRELRKLRKLRELRKLEDKRELIAIGYKTQEIPPKISFTREKRGGEQRSAGAGELRKKRELIIFGDKAQEIPPKISFTPHQTRRSGEWKYHENFLHPPPYTSCLG
ncbi:MAG: hypothetical protein F6K21_10400 [Symploca sp. SIO2D2]|nr:hypothetical protein [Symploca sp. SIO2D2]